MNNYHVTVCAQARLMARKALEGANLSVLGEGYSEGSTSYTFHVETSLARTCIQDVVWNYPGLGMISCNINPVKFNEETETWSRVCPTCG